MSVTAVPLSNAPNIVVTLKQCGSGPYAPLPIKVEQNGFIPLLIKVLTFSKCHQSLWSKLITAVCKWVKRVFERRIIPASLATLSAALTASNTLLSTGVHASNRLFATLQGIKYTNLLTPPTRPVTKPRQTPPR